MYSNIAAKLVWNSIYQIQRNVIKCTSLLIGSSIAHHFSPLIYLTTLTHTNCILNPIKCNSSTRLYSSMFILESILNISLCWPLIASGSMSMRGYLNLTHQQHTPPPGFNRSSRRRRKDPRTKAGSLNCRSLALLANWPPSSKRRIQLARPLSKSRANRNLKFDSQYLPKIA